MQIHRIVSRITNWDVSGGKFQFPLSCMEKQAFVLSFPDNKPETENKYIAGFIVNIYMTNMETDFIIDAVIETMILFDIDTAVPTKEEVYSLYCSVNKDANRIVQLKAKEIDTDIDAAWEPAPFEILEAKITKEIQTMLSE